jgi:hypothetical protein
VAEQDSLSDWRTLAALSLLSTRTAGTLTRHFDRRNDDLAHFGVDLTKTMLETLQYPVGCFVAAASIDSRSIQAIHLQLNRNDGQSLALDQLQIV